MGKVSALPQLINRVRVLRATCAIPLHASLHNAMYATPLQLRHAIVTHKKRLRSLGQWRAFAHARTVHTPMTCVWHTKSACRPLHSPTCPPPHTLESVAVVSAAADVYKARSNGACVVPSTLGLLLFGTSQTHG